MRNTVRAAGVDVQQSAHPLAARSIGAHAGAVLACWNAESVLLDATVYPLGSRGPGIGVRLGRVSLERSAKRHRALAPYGEDRQAYGLGPSVALQAPGPVDSRGAGMARPALKW